MPGIKNIVRFVTAGRSKIPYMTDEKFRIAIITGGAGGLGRALAHRLSNDGLQVAVADVEPGPGELLSVQVDVTDPESAAAMCAQVHDGWAASTSWSVTPGLPGQPLR